MGNQFSGRSKSYQKKRTVESCRRITPRECGHVGAATVAVSVAGTRATRLYALCACGSRAGFLYQAPDDPRWLCRACCAGGLIYSRQQQRGTRAAFVEWFTPEQRELLAADHPARKALHEWYGREWFAHVAPFDYARADMARRDELIARFGTARAALWEYERRVDTFMERLRQKEIETGQRINDDIWAFWKGQYRSLYRRVTQEQSATQKMPFICVSK